MTKKHLIATLLLLVVGLAGGFNAYNQSQVPQVSDVTLANIEALAGDGPVGEVSLGSMCELIPNYPVVCVYPAGENFPEFRARGRLVSDAGDGAYEMWVGYPHTPEGK